VPLTVSGWSGESSTRWRFLRDFWADFLSACGISSEDADKVLDTGLDGPGSGKTKGIEAGGGRED